MKTQLKYIKGNIFTSKAQTLVNTVNCVGVMGAGIALEFKYRYPDMFEKYVKYCQEGLIQVGKLWIYDINNSDKKILNFPTKQHWKYPSKYDYLQKGLSRFVETYKEKGITSVAFPMLGALNGGLDPDQVLFIMKGYLELCDIPVEIYEYDSNSADDLFKNFSDTFLNNDIKSLERLTGFKSNVIKKLKDLLEKRNIISLIQLDKMKGIGEETVKACYQFAMRVKFQPIELTNDIFSSINKENSLITPKIGASQPESEHQKQETIINKELKERNDSNINFESPSALMNNKLFVVYCGYFDNLSGGVYESKINLFIIAENLEQAKLRASLTDQVKQYKMHIDSAQEVEMINGFTLSFQQTGGNETKIYNHIFREFV